MKALVVGLWTAAALSFIAAGATLGEVHFQRTMQTQLGHIHQQLTLAKTSSQTMAGQLQALQQINVASGRLNKELQTTVSTSSQVVVQLDQLKNIVGSIHDRLQSIEDNTQSAHRVVSKGLSPTEDVNALLAKVQSESQAVVGHLNSMVTLENTLNQILQETNNKLP